ncbi:hypothetical protein [Paenibacillus bovis]|uniref:DUF3887 domain-containing protein n=1 Tax=Paenibacillus bovis TaxID=1616788 RepID=A0A172ZHD8_9BACL|nr:hypothetical protein [Paenibacillus bovis]ANF97054.1 hypothetical protein AR543_14280 [Paenibacillus bovis]
MKQRMYKPTIILGAALLSVSMGSQVSAQSAIHSAKPIVASSAAVANPYANAGIDSPAQFHTFFNHLKYAVQHNNKKAVATMVNYPLRMNSDGQTMKIKNKSQFIQKYNQILTPEVRKALLVQREKNLIVNWQGVGLERGAIWMGLFDGTIKIFAVNK